MSNGQYLIRLKRLFALSDLIMNSRKAWTLTDIAAALPEWYGGATSQNFIKPAFSHQGARAYRILREDVRLLLELRPVYAFRGPQTGNPKYIARAGIGLLNESEIFT